MTAKKGKWTHIIFTDKGLSYEAMADIILKENARAAGEASRLPNETGDGYLVIRNLEHGPACTQGKPKTNE
jgi:hypothetical protein